MIVSEILSYLENKIYFNKDPAKIISDTNGCSCFNKYLDRWRLD